MLLIANRRDGLHPVGCLLGVCAACLWAECREVWSAVAPPVTTQTNRGSPAWRVSSIVVPTHATRPPRRGSPTPYCSYVRAGQIAEEFPVVTGDSDALDAVRLIAERRLAGLVVTDEHGCPTTILPASEVVRMLVPGYVQDDPSLAGVLSESMADRIADKLSGKTVAAVLPKPRPEMPTVKADDTIVEVAAVMAHERAPLVAVLAGKNLIGVITASRLLEVALQAK